MWSFSFRAWRVPEGDPDYLIPEPRAWIGFLRFNLRGKEVLGRPKSSFRFFHMSLQKNLNELFSQPLRSQLDSLSQTVNERLHFSRCLLHNFKWKKIIWWFNAAFVFLNSLGASCYSTHVFLKKCILIRVPCDNDKAWIPGGISKDAVGIWLLNFP